MEMLMRYYLDDAFRPEYLEWVADVHSTEYYINMMRAWYFATALAKQPDAALPQAREVWPRPVGRMPGDRPLGACLFCRCAGARTPTAAPLRLERRMYAGKDF